MTNTELVEKIERASGPDREMDAEIAVALAVGARGLLHDDHEYLSLPDRRDPGPGVTAGHYWFHCRSGMSLRSADFYTGSLDAAMTLLPDHEGVGWRITDGAGGPTAEVWCFDYDTGKELYSVGANPTATPALALLAAILKARSTDRGVG